MGILDRLRGRADMTVRDVSGLACGQVHIVGEGRRQDVLERVGGGRGDHGVLDPRQWAILMREPANAADPNAVAVYLRVGEGQAVQAGYLSRTDALRYRPALDLIAPAHVLCQAELRGGWDRPPAQRGVVTVDASGRYLGDHGDHSRCDRGNIGVVLHLPEPGDI